MRIICRIDERIVMTNFTALRNLPVRGFAATYEKYPAADISPPPRRCTGFNENLNIPIESDFKQLLHQIDFK